MTYKWSDEADPEGWIDVDGDDAVTGAKERLRVRLVPDQSGRLEVRELHLLDLGEVITPHRLRSLNIGFLGQAIPSSTLLRSATFELNAEPGSYDASGAPVGLETTPSGEPVESPLAPPNQRGYGDDFYERVASAYRTALTRKPPRPVAAIAESAGVPRSTAARWVKVARQRGKLGKTGPGKARP